jgi:TRAP-type uncharacterized transport system substrate-binding protein
MSAKTLFTLSDIRAISDRIAEQNRNADGSRAMMVDPTHPIAAKAMREVGVSREKMQQAYLAALRKIEEK